MTDYKVILDVLGSNKSNESNIQHKNRIQLHAARSEKLSVNHFFSFVHTCR
jgi:hypothetical protein